MEISSYAEEKIKEFEGLRLRAYRCAGGKITIGWGHTKNARAGMVISADEAQRWFERDIEAVEAQLQRETFWAQLGESQRDALVSFVFNLGYAAFAASSLRRKLVANVNDATIPDEFRRWVYATVNGEKKILPGLVTRREWEAQMYADL